MRKSLLIFLCTCASAGAMNFPYRTNVVYVAVTAYNAAGLESDFSNEIAITNWMGGTKRFDQFVNIAWDLETDPDVIGYKVYAGSVSHQYDRDYDAGNTNTFDVPMFFCAPTHVTVTYSISSGGLMRSPSPTGPWTPVSNPYSVTDEPGVFFIGGTTSDKVVFTRSIHP